MLPDLAEFEVRRRRLGVSQQKLARLAGVSQSLVSKMASGRAAIGYDAARKISSSLDELERAVQPGRAIDEVMNGVVSIGPSASLGEAVALMRARGFSQVPVFEDGAQKGCISESLVNDLLGNTGKDELYARKAGEVMGEMLPQVPSGTRIENIRGILKSSDAVLVTKKGKIVGIVTKTDVI